MGSKVTPRSTAATIKGRTSAVSGFTCQMGAKTGLHHDDSRISMTISNARSCGS